MAHRAGGHVVELVGDVGVEAAIAGDVRRLIEVGADLAGAVDRRQPETSCSAHIGHVRRGEDDPAHRRADRLDGGGAGLGAAAPDQGVDHGEAVGFDHDSGVGHPSPGRLTEPHRHPGCHVLQHPYRPFGVEPNPLMTGGAKSQRLRPTGRKACCGAHRCVTVRERVYCEVIADW